MTADIFRQFYRFFCSICWNVCKYKKICQINGIKIFFLNNFKKINNNKLNKIHNEIENKIQNK